MNTRIFDTLERVSGMLLFVAFPAMTTLGAFMTTRSNEAAHSIPLSAAAWLFFLWCGFVLVDAVRVVIAAHGRDVERLDVSIVMVRSRYSKIIEWLLALWWTNLFVMCLVWALVVAVYVGTNSASLALVHLVLSTAFAYCSYLFLLMALAYWGLRERGLARLVVWRSRYTVIHAIAVALAAFTVAPYVKRTETNKGRSEWQHRAAVAISAPCGCRRSLILGVRSYRAPVCTPTIFAFGWHPDSRQ